MSVLFEEVSLGEMRLRNRFVRSATWEARASQQEGRCTQQLVEFTEELALGEVGLIIMGHAFVLPNGKATPCQTGLYSDHLVEPLSQIPPRVHSHGSKVVIQLSHSGGHTKGEWISGPLVAPSPFVNLFGEEVHEMSPSDIHRTIDAFAQAARRAKEAGLDGVQIHGAHGYLVNQFLSPVWNRRRDAYGGTLSKRSRFLFEIYEAVRDQVGEGFPVLVKLASCDYIPGGLTPEDSVWVSRELARMGLDGIEVSGGSRYSSTLSHIQPHIRSGHNEAMFADAARRIKQNVTIPIILVGGIRSFEVAEGLVTGGDTDLIAMSRPFIREPHLIRRWVSGDRSPSGCLSDNLCLGPAYEGRPVRCQVSLAESQKSRGGSGGS